VWGIAVELAFIFLIRFWRAFLIAAPAGFAAAFLTGKNAIVGIAVFAGVFLVAAIAFAVRAHRRRALGYDTPIRGMFRALGRRLGG
jgi:hypothetical protein